FGLGFPFVDFALCFFQFRLFGLSPGSGILYQRLEVVGLLETQVLQEIRQAAFTGAPGAFPDNAVYVCLSEGGLGTAAGILCPRFVRWGIRIAGVVMPCPALPQVNGGDRLDRTQGAPRFACILHGVPPRLTVPVTSIGL